VVAVMPFFRVLVNKHASTGASPAVSVQHLYLRFGLLDSKHVYNWIPVPRSPPAHQTMCKCKTITSVLWALFLSSSYLPIHGGALASELTPLELEFFEKQVRPLLVEHCYKCHSTGTDEVKGGLHLDSKSGWQAGGDSGEAIVAGDPTESLLIDAVRYRGLEMPPTGMLPEAKIAVLEKWVRMGAPDPRTADRTQSGSSERQKTARRHWSFEPIQRPRVPDVRDPGWPRGDVDRFILRKLETAGIGPVADADRYTLLRRIYFDLVGLPPPASALDAFLADDSPGAVERVIDRLLASPQFGECWARHWLDVARYADTNGLDENFTFYDAWQYRNYVIRAVNADRPFDRFLTEQLAGDLLQSGSQQERDDSITATGFLVLGPKVIGATDKVQLEMDVIDEQIDTVGKAFLGLTLGCARCHDHKFDPIPTRDYYALAGIFASTETVHGNLLNRKDLSGWNLHPIGPEGEPRYTAHLAYEGAVGQLEGEQKKVNGELSRLKGRQLETTDAAAAIEPDPLAEEITRVTKRLAAIERELSELKKSAPVCPPLVMSVNDRSDPGPARVCIRGSAHQRGPSVPRGFISAITHVEPTIPESVSGRLELAQWLAGPDNPLTSRVVVNRIWHHLFGVGLVRTVDNFGVQGESPSHPELLDHLAGRFVATGWSLKQLIREFMLSRTYQLSTDYDATAIAADPANRLLWRMNRRRLTVESLRDGMLSLSDGLDLSSTESVVANLKFQATGVGIKPRLPVVSSRRSVYLPVVRNDLSDMFRLFDFTDPQTVTGRRNHTTVAPQALFMMNSPFVIEAATHAAEQLLQEPSDERELVERAYKLILGRIPEPAAVDECVSLLVDLEDAGTGDENPRVEALATLCHALLNSTQFQYLD
jgi:hypothetical protein